MMMNEAVRAHGLALVALAAMMVVGSLREAPRPSALPHRRPSMSGPHVWPYGHSAEVRTVAFSPDGRVLASGSADATIKLWEPRTGRLIRTLRGPRGTVASVEFSPDGAWLLASGDDGMVRLFDTRTWAVRRSWQVARHASVMATWARDDTIYAWECPHFMQYTGSAGHSRMLDHHTRALNVTAWEARTGRALAQFNAADLALNAVAFTPDGEYMFTGSRSLARRPQESSVGGDAAGIVNRWEVWEKKPRDRWVVPLVYGQGDEMGFLSPVLALARSPEGELATGLRGVVLLGFGKAARKLYCDPAMADQPMTTIITRLQFSPDGATLAVAHYFENSGYSPRESRIALCDVRTGRVTRTLYGYGVRENDSILWARICGLAFSPDGALLAYGGVASGGHIPRHVSPVGVYDMHRQRWLWVAKGTAPEARW